MRWIFRAIGALAVLALLGVVALLMIPSERIARLAEAQVEAATGRGFTIAGDVRPSLWPSPRVRLSEVRLEAADWASAGPLLEAAGLEVSVGWPALWGGGLRITGLVLRRPRLVLEIDPDGRRSWETGEDGAPAARGGGGGLPDLAVDAARIEGGSLRLVDRRQGTETSVEALNLALAMPALEKPAELAGTGRIAGQSLRIEGSLGSVAGLFAEGAVPLQVRAALGGASLDFDGRAGLHPVAAEGELTADLSDRAGLFAALGQAAHVLPQGLGQERLTLAGRATWAGGRLSLRAATLMLDDNWLALEADLTPGPVPVLTARLDAGALDLPGTVSEDQNAAAPADEGWSEAPLDLSALGAVDGTVSFTADSLALGGMHLGAVETVTTLDSARAVTDLRRVDAYGGRLNGQVVVNARKGLSARLSLVLADLLVQPLLTDLADFDRLATTAEASLDVLADGQSLAAMMRSLSGTVALRTGPGEIQGLDLAGMLRTLDAGYRGAGAKTIFSEIAATGRIEEGVLRNDDLSLSAPLLEATGAGRVDLGAQTLNYTLTPRLLAGERAGLRVPLRLTGPWSAPVVHLAVEDLVQERLEQEKDRAVDRAEDALQRRAMDELGLEPAPGESARDAIGKALEDRAIKGLRDLLGR